MGIRQFRPLSAELVQVYKKLVADLDEKIVEISSSSLQKQLNCVPGCDECCMQFSVLPIEAAVVAEAVQIHPVTAEIRGDGCRLLCESRCTIYDMRPLICRTQGLPLAYVDEEAGTIEVSACQKNFPDDYPLSHQELFYMDPFNDRLARLNEQYCEENGLDPRKRIPLAACLS